MAKISKILAREILDSRGNPTVEVEVYTDPYVRGRAAAPSGASTGEHEALELRDGDPKRYMGKGVQKAVHNVVERIAPKLIGMDSREQAAIDALMIEMDGMDNKSKLGANAILAVSLAVAKASAVGYRIPLYRYVSGLYGMSTQPELLPLPMMNILNGGAHADNKVDIQEFMIMPVGATNFSDALRTSVEVFHHLRSVLKKRGYSTNVGDEGGFAPGVASNREAMEALLEAIDVAGYKAGKDFMIALDVASSELYDKKTGLYTLKKSSSKQFSSPEWAAFWADWINKYPIYSIEDGMAEDDWEGWKLLTDSLGKKIQLVGDDLFVTNEKRLAEGMKKGVANSVLVKVNQIGTLTETMNTVRLAQKHNYTTIMSHRSAETEDTTIADLAVGLSCGQIKTGGLSRTDRVAKYNRLLRIAESLGSSARFYHAYV